MHIALGATPDTLSVEWVTMDDVPCTTGSTVLYGESQESLTMVSEQRIDSMCGTMRTMI